MEEVRLQLRQGEAGGRGGAPAGALQEGVGGPEAAEAAQREDGHRPEHRRREHRGRRPAGGRGGRGRGLGRRRVAAAAGAREPEAGLLRRLGLQHHHGGRAAQLPLDLVHAEVVARRRGDDRHAAAARPCLVAEADGNVVGGRGHGLGDHRLPASGGGQPRARGEDRGVDQLLGHGRQLGLGLGEVLLVRDGAVAVHPVTLVQPVLGEALVRRRHVVQIPPQHVLLVLAVGVVVAAAGASAGRGAVRGGGAGRHRGRAVGGRGRGGHGAGEAARRAGLGLVRLLAGGLAAAAGVGAGAGQAGVAVVGVEVAVPRHVVQRALLGVPCTQQTVTTLSLKFITSVSSVHVYCQNEWRQPPVK